MNESASVTEKNIPGTSSESPHIWNAPYGGSHPHAQATVAIPGSKSLTNRYLLLAAIADSPSTLRAPLHSRDSALMIAALEQLGAKFEEIATESPFGPDLHVTPINFSCLTPCHKNIDVGLAGTVMRFVPPLAALLSGSFSFDGDPHARKRPMAPVIEALRSLGVRVEDNGTNALPFTVHATGNIYEQDLRIDASSSSQFVSALLLVACRFAHGLRLEHSGASLPSIPHIQMTVETLKNVGVNVEYQEPATWIVKAGSFAGFDVLIEPDLSNAGPFLAAAAVLGTQVSIPHWPDKTTQVGAHWQEILPLFGAKTRLQEGTLIAQGTPQFMANDHSELTIDLSHAGELAPTVAALCALRPGTSTLHGITHLRGHETDRLAALVTEINRAGGSATELPDGIRIHAPVHEPALIHSYDDHRMATTGAIFGLAVKGTQVHNIQTTAKTLPDFASMWHNMLEEFAQEVKRNG